MNKAIILIISLTGLFCKAQDKKDKYGDIALFNKAIAIYEAINEDLYLDEEIGKIDTTTIDGKSKYVDFVDMKESMLDRSLKYFTELIQEYPKSKLYFMALNNKAQLALELDDPQTARYTYIKLLESKANDKDLGGVGSGIMAEPYANYKNRACMRLAEIEYHTGNYNEALKYLKLTDKYPYQHFCGNAYAGQEIYMAEQFAKNHVALGDNKTALKYLLPLVFNNLLADNTEVVQLAVTVITKELGKQEARRQFNEAKKSLLHKVEKRPDYVGEHEFYFIKFMNMEIEVNMPLAAYTFPQGQAQGVMIDHIENSLMNKLLNE
jgi:tetratricopeptide (TPR) repeat protein